MFEPILIKKLINSGEFFSKIISIIEPKYFTSQGYSKLVYLIKNHYIEYKEIPSMTELVAQIKNVPNIELRKVIVEDLQKINNTELVQNTEFMLKESIDFIKNAIFTEALILGSDGLTEKDEAKKIKARELMEEMAKISINSDLGLDFDDIEKMIEYYQNKLMGILTQHEQLNKRLGTGFLPGTLSIFMAQSGGGKSLLMSDLISGHIKENKNVLLVSMEMQDAELMKRVHANTLDLPINDLSNLDPIVIRRAHNALKHTGKFYIKDYPTGAFSALMLDGLLDNYKTEKGIEFDIVYLDYLGIMKSDLITPSAGLYSYIKSIVEEVRSIATKRRIPIVSASQLNRSATGNQVDMKNVNNDSVSDSLGTVQTADFILFLLQNEQMKAENLVTLKVTKNRFTGRTDFWNMNIDYTKMRFKDAPVEGEIGMDKSEIDKTIKVIKQKDIEIIKKHDNNLNLDSDFSDNSGNSGTKIKDEVDLNELLGL